MNDGPSSPVCYAAQADDVYMGYAGREEILTALNELLEAERAGARVASQSRAATIDADMADLLKNVGMDEARWCAMLTRQIARIGGSASPICGAFYDKAMVIPDLVERLGFLNRGQGWVVRKITALLPRVRDEVLHANLRAMLEGHDTNIATAASYLKNHR
ncbi:MAG: DUF6306 domain-containing protein [Sphingomonadaceae bacterium]